MARSCLMGGGPVLYLTDEAAEDTAIGPYRLFRDHPGCGEERSIASDPRVNGNRVPWALADARPSEARTLAGWDRSFATRPDMGFGALFPTSDVRLARLVQAFDRHTNWGPTGYYMLGATAPERRGTDGWTAHVDAAAVRAGRALDFDHDYFNEPPLSNDAFEERGLDRFGWVPETELCANIYLV